VRVDVEGQVAELEADELHLPLRGRDEVGNASEGQVEVRVDAGGGAAATGARADRDGRAARDSRHGRPEWVDAAAELREVDAREDRDAAARARQVRELERLERALVGQLEVLDLDALVGGREEELALDLEPVAVAEEEVLEEQRPEQRA